MPSSPTQPTNSAKRPLEEASSPSRATDQPDAKRPALDKAKSDEDDEHLEEAAPEDAQDSPEKNGDESPDGVETETPEQAAKDDGSEDATTSAADAVPSNTHTDAANDETTWIHVRAVISSPEAATIIGKGGENVSSIRKMSNAKCTVSDYQKGAVERILTVSGVVDAVAKVS